MITKLSSSQWHFGRTALLACLFSAASAYASPQVATPTFSPVAGTYTSGQTVTISTTTSGAIILYTTDGSTPTEDNSLPYVGSVSISSSTMLKAIADETGFTDSPLASGIYTITISPAPILNVMYDFNVANNGACNPAGLVQGSDGNFYGPTSHGGSVNDAGTIFRMTPAGDLTTLHAFDVTDGAGPVARLVQGGDGNFYGTTNFGGPDSNSNGTLFKITPAGVLTTLDLLDGTTEDDPAGGLIQGTDGNFYGTSEATNGGESTTGTVFKMTSTGALTTLVSFDGPNGGSPSAGLVQGSDGNFYGTTSDGSSNNYGSIFKITPAGILTTLVSFNGANGAQPLGGLVQYSDGNFYGTTRLGGSTYVSGSNYGDGTVFKITPAGVLTTLVSFTGANGIEPWAALVVGSDGNFYGSTQGDGVLDYGTIFKMTPSGVLTTLVSFNGANGANPQCALLQGTDGNFYGTTDNGGASIGGVIFQLIVPSLPSQVAAPTFSPAAGTYSSAQRVTITSATSGAAIRCTTDGSTPTESNGTPYSGPVSIGATTTLKAIAFESGLDSPVTSGGYTITQPASPAPTPAPTPTPSSGGGGGGAFDDWFLAFLALAGILRWKLCRIQTA